MSTKQPQLAFGILAERFMDRNNTLRITPALRAALAATVAGVLIGFAGQASAQQQVNWSQYVGGKAAAPTFLQARASFDGLKSAAQKVFGAVGDAIQGAAALAVRPVTDNTLSVTPADMEANAEGMAQTARKSWRVVKSAGGGAMKQLMSPDGATVWLNRKGQPQDAGSQPAVRYPDGGFEHFSGGKLAPKPGTTLVARTGEGVEIHMQDGQLTQRAPVVEAKIKPVTRQLSMR